MRLGIVSDTHGNLENLRRVAEELVENWDVDFIIHLGDECEDIKVLYEFEVEVVLVHGVYCRHYQDPEIPNRLLCQFDGYRFLLTHTDTKHKNDLPGDPDPQEWLQAARWTWYCMVIPYTVLNRKTVLYGLIRVI